MRREMKRSSSTKRGDDALRKILGTEGRAELQREGRESHGVEGQVVMVQIADIAPNPFQPRRHFDPEKLAALAKSLKDRGILQPVTVRKNTRPSGSVYELIFGERRLRAAKEAGMTEIPTIVKNVADEDTKVLTLVENLQREDLNVIEKMLSIGELNRQLGDTAVTAEAVRLTRRSIERYVRVFKVLASSKSLLSFFEMNSNLIEFSDADALIEIVPTLKKEEIDKLLEFANLEGIKNAIKHFKKTSDESRKADRAVFCRIRETCHQVCLQINYPKGSGIRDKDRERFQNTFEDFLSRLK